MRRGCWSTTGPVTPDGPDMIPEQAEALQVERWRQLPPEERMRMVFARIEDGFALPAASIRAVRRKRISWVEGLPLDWGPW